MQPAATTATESLPRLQVKGALQEGSLYIERSADAQLERALLNGEYCYVLAPRQIGKSSLRLHVARALTVQGLRCVHIDLTLIGGQDDIEPRRGWYFSLINTIAAQLGLPDPLSFWQHRGDALPAYHFGRYLREQVLGQIAAPIVIFLDEIDYLKSLPFDGDEFIDAIRAYYNTRAEDGVYKRLTFCLLGVTAPAELIRNPQITPFNVGRPISLEDFSRLELEEFLPMVTPLGGGASVWLDEIYRWTAGHPYMTQALCQCLGRQRDGNTEESISQKVERAISGLFLRRGRSADPNLSYAEKRLDSQPDPLRKAELLALYRRLLEEHIVSLVGDDPVQQELQLCGLVAQQDCAMGSRRLSVRNRVFARLFDLGWVKDKESQRKLSQALRRWQESGGRHEALIRGKELEDAQAWAGEHAREVTQDENAFLRACLDGARLEAVQMRLASEARNQRLIVMGLTVVILLLVGLVAGLYWQFRRAEQSAQDARSARDEAQRMAFSESASKRAAQISAERATKAASAERKATEDAKWQQQQAEQATEREQQARREAEQAALQERKARSDAEQEKKRAEQERTHAEQAALREQMSRQQAESALRIEQSLRATILAVQPGNLVQALVAGMRAAQPERKTGLGPQWEGANRVAEESTLAQILQGHTGSVFAARFSPDGQRIVTANGDRIARIWDAKQGRILLSLQGHEGSVLSVVYSPSGRQILTGSQDRTAKVWDAQDGRLLLSLQGHLGFVFSAAYSTDGKRIVTASSDHTAKVWDSADGHLLLSLRGHSDKVMSAMYSPDRQRIVTASLDGTARIWDSIEGQMVLSLQGHSGGVLAAVYAPDGGRIVTTGWDTTARVWDANKGVQLFRLDGHADWVRSAGYSSDGHRILTASDDRSVRVWDSNNGHPLLSLLGHSGWVRSAEYSPDGELIVTASEDGTVRVWGIKGGRLLRSLQGHSDGVCCAAYAPDGKRVVTASADHTAKVWDTLSGKLLLTLDGHSGSLSAVAYSPDGKRIVTASADHTTIVWNARDGALLRKLEGPRGGVLAAAYSPNGQRIVTVDEEATMRVWDANKGVELHGRRLLHRALSGAFSPDGQRIVTANQDGTVEVLSAEDASTLLSFQGHAEEVWSATYSPDGQRIVTASSDHTAKIWDAKEGRMLLSLQGHSNIVYSAAYSSDGHRVVTASSDRTARIWDAREGRMLLSLQGHSARVASAAYSPDGQHIITASDDRTALIHPIDTETIYTFNCQLLRNLRHLSKVPATEVDAILFTCPPPQRISSDLLPDRR